MGGYLSLKRDSVLYTFLFLFGVPRKTVCACDLNNTSPLVCMYVSYVHESHEVTSVSVYFFLQDTKIFSNLAISSLYEVV
jgi:hypothetical protein